MKFPNIILLIGEDTGVQLRCYGDGYAQTPNLDALAAAGGQYLNAFSTSPVCAPARSSLVTGTYPWSIGTHHMRSQLRTPPRMFTHELRDAGYHVNWPTKRDFNFEPLAGWADACEENRADADWLGALRDGSLPAHPFFLFCNFFVTHESTMWPGPFGHDVGAHKYRDEFNHLLEPGLRHDAVDAPLPAYLPDTPEVRQNVAWYYDALSIQDAQVGNVLKALDASPYCDNTVVIYLSDHGRGLPREKRWCYDAGLHVPLIVRGPGCPAGETLSELVSWVDIAPTILSLAGVPIPKHYQGRAFLGSARGAQPRQYCFSGRDRIGENYEHIRTVRDERWRYIRNFWPELPYAQPNEYMDRLATTQTLRRLHAENALCGSAALWMSDDKPREELYDVSVDPQMLTNLANYDSTDDIVSTLDRMRDALDDHIALVGDLAKTSERELIAQGLVDDRISRIREAHTNTKHSHGRVACELEEALQLRHSPNPPS